MYVGDVGHWAVSPVSTGGSTQEPLSVDEMRLHLRVGSDTDDVTIAAKLKSARARIEGRTSRRYIRQQLDLGVDRFPCDGSPIRLPVMPLVSVDRITYYDTDGTSQDFGSSGWFVDTFSEPGRVCLKSGYAWPTGVRDQLAGVLRFTAGYTTNPAQGIPDPLIEAQRKLATELYENREAASLGNSMNEPLPYGLEELLSDYVLPEVG